MSRSVVAFVCGLVFGIGLIVSQMSNPEKVIGFLDISGQWDPSLSLVMAGAVAVFSIAVLLSRGRQKPLLESRFHVPEKTRLDKSLISGSVIFGMGWGLAGFCPGPAIVSSGFGEPRVWAFVAAMLLGTFLSRTILKRKAI